MNVQERLRTAIAQQEDRLRTEVPPDRQAAIVALLRVQDARQAAGEHRPDLLTGRRLANLAGNKALELCFAGVGDVVDGGDEKGDRLDDWAERFLQECADLAKAELVLSHCETGFMRLVEGGDERFDAWIATKRLPASWRERADIDWWAGLLARRYEPDVRELQSRPSDGSMADVLLKTMSYQLSYPDDAVIGDCSVRMYRDVLRTLVAWALQANGEGAVTAARSEREIVAAIAAVLGVDAAVVGPAVAAFTVDRESASYHAAVPGVAAPPLVRVAPDRIILSVNGLTTEPLFFLARELRRRDAQAYHNSAYLREHVFRQDLYGLFQDKRFVTSAGRIELRREAGDVRTDLDAVVFDRKTGTLGLFELKSQDPYARSTAELARQRDNVLYANRQMSGVLDWLKRHGGDALLGRLDTRTAKTFRVQKVFPFVLGRYLVHFGDGPEPDRRAAWGTWPQLLRLLDGQPLRATDSNPLASLHARLSKDAPLGPPLADMPAHRIAIGNIQLVVHPSYAAFQAALRLSGV